MPRYLVLLFLLFASPAWAFQADTGTAKGDGVTDDTSALQLVLNAGRTIMLDSGKTYRITKRLDIVHSDSGIIGDGTSTLLLGSKPGEFDNDIPEGKYRDDAVGILAQNLSGVQIRGVRIRYEAGIDDRYVKAIAVRNCTGFRIISNDIANFSKSDGIVYIGASSDGLISRNEIHDSQTNSATRGQLSGIVLDDDDKGSSGIRISGNNIHDLTVGDEFYAKFDYQSDGINVTYRSRNIEISDNTITNVGEAVDLFSMETRVENNAIANVYAFGIKLVHGASGNTIRNNIIRNAGIGGIVIGGSSAVTRDTADNLITGNRIIGVNTDGRRNKNTTFGIGIVSNKGTTYLARRNRVVANTIDLDGGAQFGLLAQKDSGELNEVRGNIVKGWSRRELQLDPISVPDTRN